MSYVVHIIMTLAVIATSRVISAELSQPSVLTKRGSHNFILDFDNPLLLARRNLTLSRRSTNYEQDYTTGGTVSFSPANGEFYVSWDTTDDFVVGVGWNPGDTEPITHAGSFSIDSGLASLSVYGWSTNPLVEYYIIDEEVNMDQGGTKKGTVYSDGATYSIWENERVNEPSIEGTATFNQYISIRDSSRVSGTITVENHFNAWRELGMDLGTLNLQVVAVESWSGSGSCYQTVTK